MLGSQITPAKPVTRDQWVRILSDNRQYSWPPRHPRERRTRERHRIPALATLTFESAGGSGKQTVYPRRPVIDASCDGLAISSYRHIPAGTALSIEMIVGDRRFLLTGRVLHSSGLPSSVNVGVALEFADPGEE
jgi:hypothetical protein